MMPEDGSQRFSPQKEPVAQNPESIPNKDLEPASQHRSCNISFGPLREAKYSRYADYPSVYFIMEARHT